MATQSMSGAAVQAKITTEANKYARLMADDVWTLEYAHSQLVQGNLDLFQTAGLAKAIACFQCSAD